MLARIIKILINSLVFTLLIEIIVAKTLKIKEKKDLINIVLVNIVTNPIVVLFPYVIGLYFGIKCRYILLFMLELLTVLFEGLVYKKNLKYNKINPYIISIILNLCSYLIGDIINNIIY